MSDPTFTQWLRDEGHVRPEPASWVLARRTPRIVARYGEDVTCFSSKRLAELKEQHRMLVRDERLEQIAVRYELRPHHLGALVEAFEVGQGRVA